MRHRIPTTPTEVEKQDALGCSEHYLSRYGLSLGFPRSRCHPLIALQAQFPNPKRNVHCELCRTTKSIPVARSFLSICADTATANSAISRAQRKLRGVVTIGFARRYLSIGPMIGPHERKEEPHMHRVPMMPRMMPQKSLGREACIELLYQVGRHQVPGR